MPEKHCPFCVIDETRQKILAQLDHVYVMSSNPRLCEHHFLAIPKRHVTHPARLTKAERHELWDVATEFQEKILGIKPGMGCDLRQNTRPFLPQSDLKVDHVHVHILPRTFGDELYEKCQVFEAGIFRRLSSEEIKKEAEFFEMLRAM